MSADSFLGLPSDNFYYKDMIYRKQGDFMPDWTNASDSVTEHFTVGDCLTLHNWNRLATEDDGADFDKLTTLCEKLEEVRDALDCPMKVHCIFRSTAYNQEQKILMPTGADVHSFCEAVDFDCGSELTTDEIKAILLPMLQSFGLRMEDNGPGASWVHIDLHPVMNSRFFKT
jgi:uncharacterized protein YcbK (DUF882 family)